MRWSLLLIVLLLGACKDEESDVGRKACVDKAENAQYTVTLSTVWSSATHPTEFPSGGHFSRLIGLTHNADFTLWTPGGAATEGLEDMAETGGVGLLGSEIEAAIAQGVGCTLIVDGEGFASPGGTAVTFTTPPEFPLVSLVTMIAPSPDWFIGVHGLDLRENGAWKAAVGASLQPYDAGTDSGATYNSEDADVTPHAPITEITGYPFADAGAAVPPIGAMALELK